MNDPKLLRWFLWLVCLHSVAVGLALIALPSSWLGWFGFTPDPYRFFTTQGGVFHLVMAIAYAMAARDPLGHDGLMNLIIAAKTIAFIFLSAFFLFFERISVIALSGMADGVMALVLMWLVMKVTPDVADDDQEESPA